jgi:hypothetical protein
MKKFLLVLSLSALLTACTFSLPLAPATLTPTPIQSPTRTPPPSRTPTITPTVPTPTFTRTPTPLGGQPTLHETNTSTSTPELLQLVLGGSLTQTSFVQGFVSILLSTAQIYWGRCDLPKEVSVIAQVSDASQVANVTLFLRLKYKSLEIFSSWDTGALMTSHFNGTFTHAFRSEEIKNYSSYSDAWVQMQFVSTDKNGIILDRTPIFSNNLGLTACPPG